MILSNLKKNLSKLDNNASLSTGWFDKKNSMIAKIHEYGAMINVTPKMRNLFSSRYGIHLKESTTQFKIPIRAHRAQAISSNSKKWSDDFAKYLKNNKYDLDKSLNQLGEEMVKDYKQTIKDGNFQPLSSFTMQVRKVEGISGNSPLIATGKFVDSIAYKVKSS